VERADIVAIMTMKTPDISVDDFVLFVLVFEFAYLSIAGSICMAVDAWQVLVVYLGRGKQGGLYIRDQRSGRIVSRRLGLMFGTHTE
jgi:hypothetical protein